MYDMTNHTSIKAKIARTVERLVTEISRRLIFSILYVSLCLEEKDSASTEPNIISAQAMKCFCWISSFSMYLPRSKLKMIENGANVHSSDWSAKSSETRFSGIPKNIVMRPAHHRGWRRMLPPVSSECL